MELSWVLAGRSLLHHPSFWRCPDFSFFLRGRVRHKLLHLGDAPILLFLRNYTGDIGSLVKNLLMIAVIKYLLGFVGRFSAVAFILTVIWTFPGRIRHKLFISEMIQIFFGPGGLARIFIFILTTIERSFLRIFDCSLNEWGDMDWVDSFYRSGYFHCLIARKSSLNMHHSHDQYRFASRLFNIIEYFFR